MLFRTCIHNYEHYVYLFSSFYRETKTGFTESPPLVLVVMEMALGGHHFLKGSDCSQSLLLKLCRDVRTTEQNIGG